MVLVPLSRYCSSCFSFVQTLFYQIAVKNVWYQSKGCVQIAENRPNTLSLKSIKNNIVWRKIKRILVLGKSKNMSKIQTKGQSFAKKLVQFSMFLFNSIQNSSLFSMLIVVSQRKMVDKSFKIFKRFFFHHKVFLGMIRNFSQQNRWGNTCLP